MSPERNIVVSHRFLFPAERVLEAWLDPEQARKFLFVTDTGEMVRAEIEPRVGGTFIITERRGDEEIEHTGKYLKIDRPSKLPQRLSFTLRVPEALAGGGAHLRFTSCRARTAASFS